jgi:hypothetical protein
LGFFNKLLSQDASSGICFYTQPEFVPYLGPSPR